MGIKFRDNLRKGQSGVLFLSIHPFHLRAKIPPAFKNNP